MMHRTLTGYNAGMVLCGAAKTSEHVFWHAAYCSEKQMSSAEMCAACKAIWTAEDSEE